MLNATIAVITYKRPLWLKRLLDELNKQIVDKKYVVEILIVDNALDQETKKQVDLASINSNFFIRYETEPVQGIVAARNKCVEVFLESNSENLIFIDDDEWPEKTNWVQTLLDNRAYYAADIVTSHVISVGEEGTPPWAVNLIYGKNSYQSGDILKIFYTNNLLISRRVLEAIKPAFDSRFAMTGASDYHFALKCAGMNFLAVYVNAPVIEEFPKSRATIGWFIRRGFRSGIGYTRSHLYEEKFLVAVLRCFALSLIRFFRGISYLLVGILSLDKLQIIDGFFRISSFAGTIAGFFGVKYDEYNVIHGK